MLSGNPPMIIFESRKLVDQHTKMYAHRTLKNTFKGISNIQRVQYQIHSNFNLRRFFQQSYQIWPCGGLFRQPQDKQGISQGLNTATLKALPCTYPYTQPHTLTPQHTPVKSQHAAYAKRWSKASHCPCTAYVNPISTLSSLSAAASSNGTLISLWLHLFFLHIIVEINNLSPQSVWGIFP